MRRRHDQALMNGCGHAGQLSTPSQGMWTLWPFHRQTAYRTPPADDGHWYMRERAATDSGISLTDIARLARDPDEVVRIAIALNPATPAHILRVLATDLHPHVQAAIGHRRRHDLYEYAASLDTHAQEVARELVIAGFPGWPTDLRRLLASMGLVHRPVSDGDNRILSDHTTN